MAKIRRDLNREHRHKMKGGVLIDLYQKTPAELKMCKEAAIRVLDRYFDVSGGRDYWQYIINIICQLEEGKTL